MTGTEGEWAYLQSADIIVELAGIKIANICDCADALDALKVSLPVEKYNIYGYEEYRQTNLSILSS